MTKEEFESIVSEQKEKGMSEEDIAKAFAVMFREGLVDRKQLEALLGGLGYELDDELKSLSDDELKERIIVEDEPVTKEEAKEGDEGEPAPSDKEAPKDEKPEAEEETKDEPKKETEEEVEEKSEEKEEDGEEIDEKEEAFKAFGLR